MYGLMPYKPSYKLSYNPFKEMEDFEKRFFGSGASSFFGNVELAEFKTDISDKGDSFLLEADLPGFKKDDISLEIDGDTLTIEAARHSEYEKKEEQGKYVCCERSFGSYSRKYDISAVDADAISAKLEDGVLKLTLPKKQPQMPASRKVEIA